MGRFFLPRALPCEEGAHDARLRPFPTMRMQTTSMVYGAATPAWGGEAREEGGSFLLPAHGLR